MRIYRWALPLPNSRFSLPLAVKFSNSTDAGQFVAYASTFGGPPDSYGDIVSPGAFKATIAQHRADGTAPALLWSHDPGMPCGAITQMQEDKKGLRIEGQLALDVEKGRDAYALLKLGGLSLSIGYMIDASSPNGKRGRVLKAVKLLEVSVVAIPVNPHAQFVSVKSPDRSTLTQEIMAASRLIANSVI